MPWEVKVIKNQTNYGLSQFFSSFNLFFNKIKTKPSTNNPSFIQLYKLTGEDI